MGFSPFFEEGFGLIELLEFSFLGAKLTVVNVSPSPPSPLWRIEMVEHLVKDDISNKFKWDLLSIESPIHFDQLRLVGI